MRKIILLSYLWAAISLGIFYGGMTLHKEGLAVGGQMMCAVMLSMLLIGTFAMAFGIKVILKQQEQKKI